MIKYIPLREWTATGIPVEPPFSYLNEVGMLPLSDNELLLSAHYFPIVIRIDEQQPSLGAIMRRDLTIREPVTANGRWAGAYSPIMLRCFPFRFAASTATGDPIADLEFGRVPLKSDKPRLVRMRDDAGAASKDLKALYDGVKSVWEGQQRLRPAIEALMAADLLVPIGQPTAAHPEIYCTIDRHRFAKWSKHALGAMARSSFEPIDLATTLSFSQVHLRPELRPAAPLPAASEAEGNAAESTLVSGFETLTPWLDTSELFPGAWAADPSVWTNAPAAEAGRPLSAPASISPAG